MYSEVLNLSFDERVDIYMKLDKRELANMLAMRDCIESQGPINNPTFVPKENSQGCKSWEECSNPFKDCINCPLRYKASGLNIINA